jgi:hypothetical protein
MKEELKRSARFAASVFVLALSLGLADQVYADDPDFSLDPGVACADFGLDVYISNCNEHYVMKEFTDRFGNIVRLLGAGKGCDLEFVNAATDADYSIKANGSVSHTTIHSDGSQTVSAVGHNVLIFFATDLPSGVGPSTKQYVGNVVYTIDPFGTWTLVKSAGRTVDICAELFE